MFLFDTFGITMSRGTTSNGSRLTVLHKPNSPLYIRAMLRAGSRYNNVSGTAHFLEHILVSGTEKYPRKDLLAGALEQVGGSFRAYTDPDVFAIDIQIADKGDLSHAVNILNQMLCHSLFAEDVFEKERAVVQSEIRRRVANVPVHTADMLRPLMFVDAEKHFMNLGTEESLAETTLDSVKDFYTTHALAGNIEYIVCGDVTLAECVDAFSTIELPAGTVSEKSKEPTLANIERIANVESARTDTYAAVGFRTGQITPRKLAALWLLSAMLAGSKSSALVSELRYKRGLVYEIESPLLLWRNAGLIAFIVSGTSEKISTTVSAIFEVLQDFPATLTENMLIAAKTYFNKSRIIRMQTTQSWVESHSLLSILFDNESVTTIDMLNEVMSLQLSDLREICAEYFNAENAYLSVYGAKSTPMPSLPQKQ